MITRFQARRTYLNFPLEMVGRIPPTVDYGLRVKGGDMVGTTDDSLFYYATRNQHLFDTSSIQPGQQDTTPILSLFPAKHPLLFHTTFSQSPATAETHPHCACHTRQLTVTALHRHHQPINAILYPKSQYNR